MARTCGSVNAPLTLKVFGFAPLSSRSTPEPELVLSPSTVPPIVCGVLPRTEICTVAVAVV